MLHYYIETRTDRQDELKLESDDGGVVASFRFAEFPDGSGVLVVSGRDMGLHLSLENAYQISEFIRDRLDVTIVHEVRAKLRERV